MDLGLSQKIANHILRPPRTSYQIEDLGPDTFQHRNIIYERVDFDIYNKQKLNLKCSLFKQKFKNNNKSTTVIFLHANSSSRLAAKNYLNQLLPFFNVACLDCAGSGISQGKIVTLGYNQKQDLHCLIQYLQNKYEMSKFILWGRSMGAVTSLLYAAKYKNIFAVVSDNAFSDLQQLCKQLKQSYLSILPDFMLDSLLESTQQYIDQKLCKNQNISFKIKLLKPKIAVKNITCPIFYIYSEDDKIVNNRHTKNLYELSNYPKRIMSVKGDHNSVRDGYIKGKVVDFLLQLIINQKNQQNQKAQKIKKQESQTKESQQSTKYKDAKPENSYRYSLDQTSKSNKMRMSEKICQRIKLKKNNVIVSSQKNLPDKNCKIQYKQSNDSIVFESPFNKILCQSYLKNSQNKKNINNLINKQYNREQQQEDYSIQKEENKLNFKDCCLINFKEQRKRKKIFSNDR